MYLRYYLKRITALKKLRNSTDIEDDIDEMRAEEQAQRAEAKITMLELVKSPTLRLPLVIAIVMQLSQQLSGINAVSANVSNILLIQIRVSILYIIRRIYRYYYLCFRFSTIQRIFSLPLGYRKSRPSLQP